MNRRIIILSGVAIIIAFLFWYSSVLQEVFYAVVDFLGELALQNEFLAIMVFILTAALAALISPLTNIPLVPIATLIWGPFLTTIFLLVGWLVGDIIAYVIGRHLGHKIVCYIVSAEKLEEWSNVVKKHTNFRRALFLRVALPAELGYAFGIIRYHFGYFMLITFFAELPLAIVSTYASEAVLYGDTMKFFGFTGILFAFIFIAFRMTHKRK